MAKVVVTSALRGDVPLAAGDQEIAARDVFDLVRQLDAAHPGLGDTIAAKVSIAVDGVLVGDWSTLLHDDSEVMLVPHIAGG